MELRQLLNIWETVYSKKVESYLNQMDIKSGAMAVIIQHQLTPEISGVSITQSPYSIHEMLIECCSGLGDKLLLGSLHQHAIA